MNPSEPTLFELPLQAVLLTPPGRGAVATILVAGEMAEGTVQRLFEPVGRRTWVEHVENAVVFGRWRLLDGADEEVVLRRTSRRAIEVHCHGGQASVAAVLESLRSAGAVIGDWRDAIRAEEADSWAAEARIALAEAPTERTAAILLDQYHGALRRESEALRALVDAAENSPPGERPDLAAELSARLTALVSRAAVGLHLVRPWRVVLAGPPNAGKSSLINALLGYQRTIVFAEPGTTRDVVTALTAIDGWPVELSDTAGLRATYDPLEAAGIQGTRQQLARADAVVLVLDSSRAIDAEEQALQDSLPEALVVHNKCDLCGTRSFPSPHALRLSALTGEGLPALVQALALRLVPHPPPTGAAVPFHPTQIAPFTAALEAIGREDWAAASAELARNARRER